ncbi:MAG: hypothetical protein IIV97_05130 [Oscillospiraceae bacterium]|nr:hypothetical protein [Oscillospiraceae bacterium]
MLQDIRKSLNVNIDSPYWDKAFEAAEKEVSLPSWMSAEYVSEMEEKYSLFSGQLELVEKARGLICDNPELLLLVKTLYNIIAEKKPTKDLFPTFELPAAPEDSSGSLAFALCGIFPILGHVEPYAKELSDMGIEHSIIWDTLSFFRGNLKSALNREGGPLFTKGMFLAFRVFVYTSFLWIGRLRFEFHPTFGLLFRAFENDKGERVSLMCDTVLHSSGYRLGAYGFTDEEGKYDADFVETDEYFEGYAVTADGRAEKTRTRLSKSEWKCILKPGDTFLFVHIPGRGKLDPEICEESYNRAREVYSRCYPDRDIKAFVTDTWLLCPALKSFLNEDSNIVKFQDKYHLIPACNEGIDVFLYVYNKEVKTPDEVDFEALPEENSMQRGVKKLLLDSTYVHEFTGFFPF